MDPMGFPEEKLKPLTFDPILPKSGGQTKSQRFSTTFAASDFGVFFWELLPSFGSKFLFVWRTAILKCFFLFEENTIEDVQERIQVLVSIGKSSLKKRSSSCYKRSMMTWCLKSCEASETGSRKYLHFESQVGFVREFKPDNINVHLVDHPGIATWGFNFVSFLVTSKKWPPWSKTPPKFTKE